MVVINLFTRSGFMPLAHGQLIKSPQLESFLGWEDRYIAYRIEQLHLSHSKMINPSQKQKVKSNKGTIGVPKNIDT